MFSFLPTIFLPNAIRSNAAREQKSPRQAEALMADFIMSSDKNALEALYQQFADDLYHYLITLSDATLAKDIAQKTWLKVIEKPHSYHSAGSVKAWLFTVARNALIDEYRKTKRWQELDDETLSDINLSQFTGQNQDDTFESTLSSQHFDDAFDRALAQLSFEQRESFCLQQEGFSVSDIANMTNTKQETIKTRLRYARTKLKQLLEPSYE